MSRITITIEVPDGAEIAVAQSGNTRRGITPRGRRKQQSKALTDRQVVTIFKSRKRNVDLAREYKVTPHVISQVKTRRSYRAITAPLVSNFVPKADN